MEGADAIIAQGAEAGGHRGMFLGNLEEMMNCQIGTMALVSEVRLGGYVVVYFDFH
jgi:nitronate monooxygenase